MPDVDFDFDFGQADTSRDGSDVLLAGHRRRLSRRGRALWAVLALALVISGIAAAALFRRAPTVLARPSATPAPSAAPTADPGEARSALVQMITLAQSRDPLHDELADDRAVICPHFVASETAQKIMGVVRQHIAGYTFVDDSVLRGANGTVCGLTARARDLVGDTLVISVLAPPEANTARFAVSRTDDRSTATDVEVIVGSWSIEIGWLGRSGEGLAPAELRGLAEDTRLVW